MCINCTFNKSFSSLLFSPLCIEPWQKMQLFEAIDVMKYNSSKQNTSKIAGNPMTKPGITAECSQMHSPAPRYATPIPALVGLSFFASIMQRFEHCCCLCRNGNRESGVVWMQHQKVIIGDKTLIILFAQQSRNCVRIRPSILPSQEVLSYQGLCKILHSLSYVRLDKHSATLEKVKILQIG